MWVVCNLLHHVRISVKYTRDLALIEKQLPYVSLFKFKGEWRGLSQVDLMYVFGLHGFEAVIFANADQEESSCHLGDVLKGLLRNHRLKPGTKFLLTVPEHAITVEIKSELVPIDQVTSCTLDSIRENANFAQFYFLRKYTLFRVQPTAEDPSSRCHRLVRQTLKQEVYRRKVARKVGFALMKVNRLLKHCIERKKDLLLKANTPCPIEIQEASSRA